MATNHTPQLPHLGSEASGRLRALKRMSFAGQLAAILRGEHTVAEWRSIRTPTERLELLCTLGEDEQIDALRASCFTLTEWCAFARRAPHEVLMLGGEYAFIAITTPEWCER